MTPTEDNENTQEITEVETPVVEKVKKERSILQQQVLEKARARGLEVRLEKAKDRKEAKERALQEVVEKYKKKEEAEPEPEVEKFEPEPEVEDEAELEPEVEEVAEPEVEKFEPPPPPEIQKVVEVEPKPEPEPPAYVFKNKRLTYNI